MSSNTEIEEILTLKSVDVYQLCYNREEGNYDLTSIIKNSPLRIFRELILQNDKQKELAQRLALIKCKDWFYPLETGKTFVYRSRDQSLCYLFPNPDVPDSLSVVVINTELVDDVKVILFENVLLLYATLQDAPQEWKTIINQLTATDTESAIPEGAERAQSPERPTVEPRRESGTADMLARNIIHGAEMINNGIAYGTQIANNLLMRGAAHIKAGQPTETPQHNVNVDPRVISGLNGLRTASQTACTVTGYAVNAVAKGTNQLSKCLAPHVKRQSTKLISNVSGKNETDSGKICDDILTVASGGLQGFGLLYNGVTQNAKILASTVTKETVDIVNQRYGNEAGRATEDAMYATGNAAMTAINVQHLGPKAIARKAAIETGKTVVATNTHNEESQRKT